MPDLALKHVPGAPDAPPLAWWPGAPALIDPARHAAQAIADLAATDPAGARRLAAHVVAGHALHRLGLEPGRLWLGHALPQDGALRVSPAGALADRLLVVTPDGHAGLIRPDRVVTDEAGFGLAGAEAGWLDAAVLGRPLPAPALAAAIEPLRQLLVLAVGTGIVTGFLAAARQFLVTRARPWYGTGIERAADDPHVLGAFGRHIAQVRAAGELLADAAAAVGDGASDALARIATGRVYVEEAGPRLISATIELLGAPATDRSHRFDAYWRDLSTLAAIEGHPVPPSENRSL